MYKSLCSVAFRNEDLLINKIIDYTAKIGYESIEIWSKHIKSDYEIELAKEGISQNKINVSMVSPYFDFTGDEEYLIKSYNKAVRYIDIADELKSPFIRVFTGTISSDEISEKKYSQCVKILQELADIAKEKGVGFAVETHPRTLVDTTIAAKKFINDVGKDNVGLNLDIFHLWEVDGDVIKILDMLFENVFHIHAKNANHIIAKDNESPLFYHEKKASQDFSGVTYLNEGEMKYDDFINRLLELNYKHAFSIEWFGEEPIKAANHELKYLKKYF